MTPFQQIPGQEFTVHPMFSYKSDKKTIYSMYDKLFYLTDDEINDMIKTGISYDDITVFVFEMLSKQRLADFSNLNMSMFDRVTTK